MIEILIPTFNRAPFLEKNLNLLTKQISDANLEEIISISISDNCSEDETLNIVKHVKNNSNIHINLYVQKENIGLEKNAIFLLEKSTEKFIMYVGDDDYLPEKYIQYLVEKINGIENLTCVLPGFSFLFPNGTIKPARRAYFNEKIYEASFRTVIQISQYGHQLSGVLLKREGLYQKYMANDKLRNIYPFIYFVAYNTLHGTSIYTPRYQVLVSQSNSKDWNYDDSGLLTEIFKNYKLLFPTSYIKRNIMNFVFMNQQVWRLRIGPGFKETFKSFIHLEKDDNLDFLTKLLLPIFYGYQYMRIIFSKVKRIIVV